MSKCYRQMLMLIQMLTTDHGLSEAVLEQAVAHSSNQQLLQKISSEAHQAEGGKLKQTPYEVSKHHLFFKFSTVKYWQCGRHNFLLLKFVILFCVSSTESICNQEEILDVLLLVLS